MIKNAFILIGFTFALFLAVVVYNTHRIDENTRRIDEIKELYQRSTDRWRKADHDAFVQELKRLNPGLKMPEK